MTKTFMAAVAALAIAGAAGTAEAHAHLVSAAPARQETIHASPAMIRATFNEGLVAGFSTLALTDKAGKTLPLAKSALSPDRKTIEAAVSKPLAPGDYVVRWRVVSADTHRINGSYGFTLRP